MENEYPFRPRGRHGFDREDVINYISQAQQRCNEHLARMEELEAAKNAWYTQVKNMEREKTALVARNRELEEQLDRGIAPAGGDWFPQNDPMLNPFSDAGSSVEAQELAAVQARCLELEDRLEQQRLQQAEQEQALTEAREAADALRREADTLRAEQQRQEAELPRFTMHQQEIETLRAKLEQQITAVQTQASYAASLEQEKTAAAQQYNLLQQENFTLTQKLTALENENAVYAAQMPALQEQLTQLAQSAEQISSLEAMKAGLAAELEETKAQMDALAQKAAAQSESTAALQAEKDALLRRCDALAQTAEQARQQYEALETETETLRSKLHELENENAPPTEETLRSMVLASFNYSNLYVDNNLKTAQFISEATSRNIGRVSDSANSLLEQLEAMSRSFNDTTDGIRRNLATFQRELGTIQSGMNRRLSKDRFAALLEENERLRTQLETELLAELNEEDESAQPAPGAQPAPLPFAEDLPQNYHEYLDN